MTSTPWTFAAESQSVGAGDAVTLLICELAGIDLELAREITPLAASSQLGRVSPRCDRLAAR